MKIIITPLSYALVFIGAFYLATIITKTNLVEIEKPIEKVIEKKVEVPVEIVKTVEVPVEKIKTVTVKESCSTANTQLEAFKVYVTETINSYPANEAVDRLTDAINPPDWKK